MNIETKTYKFVTPVDGHDYLGQVVVTLIDGMVKGCTEFFVHPNGSLYSGNHYNDVPNYINLDSAYDVEIKNTDIH